MSENEAIVQDLGGEIIVYLPGEGKVISFNETATAILRKLIDRKDHTQIVAELAEEYEAPEGELAIAVQEVVKQVEEIPLAPEELTLEE